MATSHHSPSIKPLVFGEVLYDNFPDGSRVLGGAPFNVAWHLQGFGLAPLLLTRIGTDAAGAEVVQRMGAWGMDTRGVQHDPHHPTGSVEVTLDDDQPLFHILAEQAYDHIDTDAIAPLLGDTASMLLYHGTLAARAAASRRTLHQLRDLHALPAFVDVNLRPPWWQPEEVEWALRGARWVKLNEDELRQLSGNSADPATAARALAHHHPIETLIVTLGAQGALLLHHDHLYSCAAAPVTDLVDSVGAGDAFSAVVLLGLARRWRPAQLLGNAVEFAAAICRQRGATVFDRDFYGKFLQKWED